ncbi:type VII secretion-associated serine protease mycosin [Micromonospora sp. WMMD558]|uniref:type VII secretion-associated serine protease mycosin n=1 Tax=Micromonospora sp. WMMD558 TaxID=3403462 RepID=UPI003BF4F1CD
MTVCGKRELGGLLTLAAALLVGATAPAYGSDAAHIDGVERVRGDQWHLRYLNVQKAHQVSQGEGVIVAVPDSGVDPHPDLSANLLPGTDVVAGGGDGREDQNGHGTGMAGIIAAHGRRGSIGALGIAPKARVLPIKIFDSERGAEADHLAAAVEYAISSGADVISISAAGGFSPRLSRALEDARTANVLVVASAGNRPEDPGIMYPATGPGVIAVGGIDRNGNHAAVAVAGAQIDVVAPAVDIYSTSMDNKYRKGTGTSDSAAIVAGAVALIRAKYPHLPADEVVHRLTATAVDKGPPGRDDQYGYGVIDIVAALTADVPPLGFESATAAAPAARPTEAEAERSDSDRAATTRGLVTLGVIVAAGGAWAFIARRRRRSDDPPPRISR